MFSSLRLVLLGGLLTAAGAAGLTAAATQPAQLRATTTSAHVRADDVPSAGPVSEGQTARARTPSAATSDGDAGVVPAHVGAPARDVASAATGAPPQPRRPRWDWPLKPRPGVLRPFEAPAERWTAGHRGVDLRAAVGATVLAPDDGVVSFRGIVAGRPVLSVDHPGGLRSTYDAVSSPLNRGDQARRGEPIGTVAAAAAHCGASACLHWGARRAGDYVNPLTLVGGAPVLLPLR